VSTRDIYCCSSITFVAIYSLVIPTELRKHKIVPHLGRKNLKPRNHQSVPCCNLINKKALLQTAFLAILPTGLAATLLMTFFYLFQMLVLII